METTVLLALFVSLCLRAVLTLPVAQDLQSVNKTYEIFDTSVKRNKREAIVGGTCSEGHVWIFYNHNNICVTIETYKELKADDYDEMTTSSQDNLTRRPTQATTTPQPEPVSGPDKTPHSQTSSTPGPTKRPRKTPHPKPTSPSPPMTPQPVTLQVNRAEQASRHTMMTTIVFVLCVFLVHGAV